MKERFYRFMAGRYGSDDLNKFLLIVFVAVFIISLFAKGTFRSLLSIVLLAIVFVSYFRMFSKNIYKRSSENAKYLSVRRNVFTKLKNVKERFVQRKDYKFFTCPSCKATLRVPKGHGKIKIVCRRCGNSFIGKS